jgi:hypothetical protein
MTTFPINIKVENDFHRDEQTVAVYTRLLVPREAADISLGYKRVKVGLLSSPDKRIDTSYDLAVAATPLIKAVLEKTLQHLNEGGLPVFDDLVADVRLEVKDDSAI